MQRVMATDIGVRQKWLEYAQRDIWREELQPLCDTSILKKAACALNTPKRTTIGRLQSVEGDRRVFFMLVEEDHETDAEAVAKRAISQFCKRDNMRVLPCLRA